MVKQIFIGQDSTVTVGGTNITAYVRELSLSGGGRDVELIRAFGSGANTYLSEKPQEIIESEMTVVTRNFELAGYLFGGGSDGTMPVTYTGDSLRNSAFLGKALVFNMYDYTDDSGAHLKITMASVYGTNMEMSMSFDTQNESTWTFKCEPKNLTVTYTDDRVTSPNA